MLQPRCSIVLTTYKINRNTSLIHFPLTFNHLDLLVKIWRRHQCNEYPSDKDVKIPEAPTNCCMSGCANCVWLEYAEKLTKIFKDGGEISQEIILSKIHDENMKAFLRTELNHLKNIAKDKNGIQDSKDEPK